MEKKRVVQRKIAPVSYSLLPSGREKRATARERATLRRWRLRITSLVRVVFGFVWAWWAWVNIQRAFGQGAAGAFLHATGAVSTDTPWIAFWHHLIAANPQVFACVLALYISVVACGLLVGAMTHLVCLLGMILLIFCWSLPTLQLFPGELSSGDTGVLLFGLFIFIALIIAHSGILKANQQMSSVKFYPPIALAERVDLSTSKGSRDFTREHLAKR